MTLLDCSCRRDCSLLAVIFSVILGVVATKLFRKPAYFHTVMSSRTTGIKNMGDPVWGIPYFGAGGRTRTGTMSPSVDFESTTSTNSITPAGAGRLCALSLASTLIVYTILFKIASVFFGFF